MRNDDQIRDEFSGLIDDELDAETRATIEEELSDSAELLRELDQYKKVADLYRQLPRVDAPADFEARLAERMAPRVVPFWQRKAAWGVLPALAAASLVVMAGGIWWLQPDRGTQGRMQTAALDETKDSDAVAASSTASQLSRETTASEVMADDRATAFFENTTSDALPAPPPPAAEPAAPMAEAQQEQLESLGYLGDMDAPAPEPVARAEEESMADSVATPRAMAQKAAASGDRADGTEPREAPSTLPPIPELGVAASGASAPAMRSKKREATAGNRAAEATGASDEAESVAALRVMLNTTAAFELVDNVWIESGYANESLSALSDSVRDALVDRTNRAGFATVDRPVIFRADDGWYRYQPPKAEE